MFLLPAVAIVQILAGLNGYYWDKELNEAAHNFHIKRNVVACYVLYKFIWRLIYELLRLHKVRVGEKEWFGLVDKNTKGHSKFLDRDH